MKVWFLRQISAFLLGLALLIWGLQMIYDPWAQERYERSLRETVRLETKLYRYLQAALEAQQAYGIILAVAGVIIMNRLKIGFFFPLIAIISSLLLNHSHIMFKSDRFGGIKNAVGAGFYIASFSTLVLTCFDFNNKKKQQQQQVDPVNTKQKQKTE